jgi:serine/threonine protein kinase
VDSCPAFLFFQSQHNDTNIKICDFGFATREVEPNSLTTMCGSPNYVAPEIIMGNGYGKQVDTWSMGVIVFLLLGGYAPFDEPDLSSLYDRISHADYEFNEEYWNHVSEDAKDFVRKILVVDPNERITAKAAIKHPWIKVKARVLSDNDLGSTLTPLRRFNMKRKLKAAGTMVVAARRMTQMLLPAEDLKELAALAESDSE